MWTELQQSPASLETLQREVLLDPRLPRIPSMTETKSQQRRKYSGSHFWPQHREAGEVRAQHNLQDSLGLWYSTCGLRPFGSRMSDIFTLQSIAVAELQL